MIIEFLQYIAEGPDFSEYILLIYVIASTSAADIEEIIDLKNGLFWVVVRVCIAATGIMMLLYLFKVTKL